MHVIPNGIDPSELCRWTTSTRCARASPQPRREARAAGGPARLREGLPARARGAARADRAARATCASSSPARAPPSRSCASRPRALGLDDHGTFLGWIGDDVLHSLYRIADLTVVPSIYEPFGLVALEAMASGCPCLVADTGGLREVVPNEDVGLRFRSRDPRLARRTMAERLLTDDELRDRLVAEASEHVLTLRLGRRGRGRWRRVYRDVTPKQRPSRAPPAPDRALHERVELAGGALAGEGERAGRRPTAARHVAAAARSSRPRPPTGRCPRSRARRRSCRGRGRDEGASSESSQRLGPARTSSRVERGARAGEGAHDRLRLAAVARARSRSSSAPGTFMTALCGAAVTRAGRTASPPGRTRTRPSAWRERLGQGRLEGDPAEDARGHGDHAGVRLDLAGARLHPYGVVPPDRRDGSSR